MEKAKKQRTTSLLDKTVASMSRTGDTAADYAAAQRVAAAKADTTKALEGLPAHGRMTGPAGLQRKALGIVTQQGKLPSPGLLGGGDSGEEPFDADSGVAIDPSGEDTQLNQDIESHDDAILKPKGKRPPPGRVEKLAAAREKAEKEQIPLEKAVPVDEDINIILANAYMNMEHNKTLEEQIINEIENMIEEKFDENEYPVILEYVRLFIEANENKE